MPRPDPDIVTPLIRQCVDCGEEFGILGKDIEYLMSKAGELPDRCKSCYAKKKRERKCRRERNS
jgi:hypothetical protein